MTDSARETSGSRPGRRLRRPLLAVIEALLVSGIPCAVSGAQIVINEIHFDAEPRNVREEFVEFHNPGPRDLDVSGWSLAGDVEFTFPPASRISSGGYMVVAEDPSVLRSRFNLAAHLVWGPYAKALPDNRGTLILQDAAGTVVDEVHYDSGFPWPTAASGAGSSMELIHPSLDNELGGSWRSSGTGLTLPPCTVYVVGGDTNWLMYRGTNEPPVDPGDWRGTDFVPDADWRSVQAPIGFGYAGIATVTCDMLLNYTSLYLRHAFIVPPGPIPQQLGLRLLVTESARVWINGVEVAQVYVPSVEQWVDVGLAGSGKYLTAGTNVLSVLAFNASLYSSMFRIDAELSQTCPRPNLNRPTPAAQNSVFATHAPPQVRQVEHHPKQPATGQTVTITAKVTDPEGVDRVCLDYQVVEPGHYVRRTDPDYTNQWSRLALNDAGIGGDAVAGDATFTAQIPAEIQAHRRLIRYRVTATDLLGDTITVPYEDDEQPNFAYFCSDGVPAWSGAVVPEETPVLDFPAEVMANSLPVYHLLARADDVEKCQYESCYKMARFSGALVYDGDVYDHIEFRIRGQGSTYFAGKNKWRFYFDRARGFAARDNYGRKYARKMHRLNLSACASPYVTANRGLAGLGEATAFRLFQLAGVPSSNTHWIQLRVITEAAEASSTSQYEGDFWGLYLAIEQPDGQFLEEHGYPDGDVYKMNYGAEKLHQSRDRALDLQGWQQFDADCLLAQHESWWRQSLALDVYYSFHGVCRVINNFDLRPEINHCLYLHPDGHWLPIPWDLDSLYIAGNHYTGLIRQAECLQHEAIRVEFQNRCRELLDLMFSDPRDNGGQVAQLVNELASIVNPPGQPLTLVDADQALWNHHPRTTPLHWGQYYANPAAKEFGDQLVVRTLVSADHEGFQRYLKDFMTATDPDSWAVGDGDQRGYGYNYLAFEAAATNFPAKPTVHYVGRSGFPRDDLRFETSPFDPSAPENRAEFAASQWRLGEISNPSTPGYVAGEPWKYELTPVWESPEIREFQPQMALPASVAVPGHTYRVRVRMKNGAGAWSHWSDPVEFIADAGALLVVINEWMADNRTAAAYPDGQFKDWFELFNRGDQAVDLGGYSLTDDPSRQDRWTIPAGTILGPRSYLLVWADGETVSSPAGAPLHANFKLSAEGESIGLFTPQGQLVDLVRFGPQEADVSQGRWPDGEPGMVSLPMATPGMPNRRFATDVVEREVALARTADGALRLTWRAMAGQYYRIQYKERLESPEWNVLDPAVSASTSMGSYGLPDLTGAQYFFRVVILAAPPQITQWQKLAEGQGQLRWESIPGQSYQIEYCDDLSRAPWQRMAREIHAEGSSETVVLPIQPNQNRFFRVRLTGVSP